MKVVCDYEYCDKRDSLGLGQCYHSIPHDYENLCKDEFCIIDGKRIDPCCTVKVLRKQKLDKINESQG